MAEKNGFKTVTIEKNSVEDLDEKIRNHRKKMFHRVAGLLISVVVLVVGIQLWMALRTFTTYEVQSIAERKDSEATRYTSFLGKRIEYNNDGIVYLGGGEELIWNQSFEMTSPRIDLCGDYLAIYDQGGTSIYIMSKAGLMKRLETSMPIERVKIAGQGSIAVLMKESNAAYVRLFDRKGKELANGEFFLEKGCIPMDIAFSGDGQKLAVDLLDVNGGTVKSVISFYNFGSVGQNEIDNQVGTYTYEDEIIPEIDFVSDNRMLALTRQGYVVFEGAQKPKEKKRVEFIAPVQSVFHNEKYIGVTFRNENPDLGWHIKVYDMNGSTVMENDTQIAYDTIEFLDNNEICVRDANQCEIYTIHSIKKFAYTFDSKLYKILSGSGSTSYTFILENETDEVRLK